MLSYRLKHLEIGHFWRVIVVNICVFGIIQEVIASFNMTPDSSQITSFMREAESCRVFSTNLYKTTAGASEISANIILSPLSAHVALCYLCHGAQEDTASEMISGLNIDTIERLHIGYKELLASIREVKRTDLTLANSLFIAESVQLTSIYSSLGADYYNFEIQKVSFENGDNAAKHINNWISNKTDNKITDLIKSDDIDEDTKLILVNAIHFKGLWQYPFDARHTSDRMFHISKDVSKKVPMMTNKHRYAYGRFPLYKCKFIEIPYTDENLSMIIILPNEIDGLPFVEENFDWNSVVEAERGRGEVILHLPRFKIECTTNLKGILQKMGFQKMFEDKANFSAITQTPLKVDKVIQKAFIEVNEEGSEAAAATLVQMRLKRSFEQPEEFNVNRPFMVAILHSPSNIPLFIGRVRDIGSTITKDEL